MSHIPIPEWFLLFAVIADFFFAIVAGVIAVTAWRVCRFLCSPRHKRFAMGFSLITIAFLIRGTARLAVAVGTATVFMVDVGGLFYALFFLAGLTFLLLLYLKVEGRAITAFIFTAVLFTFIPFVAVVLAQEQIAMCGIHYLDVGFESLFYLELAILFGFIIARLGGTYFGKRHAAYKEKKKELREKRLRQTRPTLFVLAGFILIAFGELAMMVMHPSPYSYVATDAVTFLGFVSILLGRMVRRR